MRNSPMVTILLAFYNSKKYILKAIDSVLNQSYSNWQLILLDDGSTDNSHQLIQQNSKDGRILYKRFLSNHGKGKVLNEGLHLAKGEFVLELDADDWLHPNAISSFVEFAKGMSPTTGLVYSDYMTIKKTGNLIVKKKIEGSPFQDRIDWVKNFFVPTPRFYRKSILTEIGGWPIDYPSEGRLYEDVALVFKLLKNYRMEYLPKTTMYVRKRYDSITFTNRYSWFSLYRFLLAKALHEWREPYHVGEILNKRLQIKEKHANRRPLVALIVPFQNHEPYISNFLQSIIHQNYANVEIIFVNDHSTDQTMERIKTKLKGERVHYKILTMTENSGEGASLKEGLKKAKGKYALFLSPYDLLNPDALEELVQKIEEAKKMDTGSIVGVYSNMKRFQSLQKFRFVRNERTQSINNLDQLLENGMNVGPILYSLPSLRKIVWPMNYVSNGKYFSQIILQSMLLKKGRFIHVPKFLSLHVASEIHQEIVNDYGPVYRILSKRIKSEE